MFTSAREHPIMECPPRPMMMDTRWKSNVELAPNCPRCASSNTKFCYYNNYSLSQPRYFCKGCRRYWTKGGSLRNVPVGGGCRKSRRAKSSRQSERLSYDLPSPGRSSNESTAEVNIDLAAVFAKFLNQDSSSNDKAAKDHDQESSSGASSTSLELPPSSMDMENQLENFMFEFQKTADLFDQGLPELCVDVDHVQEVDQNCNPLDLQAMLGDDIVEDIAWSDGASLPNSGWQPVVQFQDFGSFVSLEDHTKLASNLACDNWSSFDLSGYEIFSRP